jgi:hypothetical protein
MSTTPPSVGQPHPVDEDWQDTQAQIDEVVHEHDPPMDEPPNGQKPSRKPDGDGS